jgi:hypothetical protein
MAQLPNRATRRRYYSCQSLPPPGRTEAVAALQIARLPNREMHGDG